MGFRTTITGEYEHQYRVGDKISYQGVEYYVGDDWEELRKWACGWNPTATHIVTTCGRVIGINSLD